MGLIKKLKKTGFIFGFILLFFLVSLLLYYFHLNRIIVSKFEGKKWTIPSKVYSEGFLIYPGLPLLNDFFYARLKRLGYKKKSSENIGQGEYHLQKINDNLTNLFIYLHPVFLPHKVQKGKSVLIKFSHGKVSEIILTKIDRSVPSIQLEPELISLLFNDVAEERRIVRLHETPPELLNAILAIEDERFLEHSGVDPKGILRALLKNLKKFRFAQGGSTLTQQLVKNFFLTHEKTLKRKITEAFMAFIIEKRYSKDDILETYINEVYLGNRGPIAIHGVAEASLYYFSKDIKDLTLPESALIAGMIQAPNRYSPLKNISRARKRRNLVLEKMYALKKIVRSEYLQSKHTSIVPHPSPLEVGKKAPYFIDFIKSELKENYSEKTLTSEGLYIFTTLDVSLQKEAQNIIEKHLTYLEKEDPKLVNENNPLQASLISLEPHTGFIKAMIGGRNYQKSQFNRISQSKRQPGSLFKPFIYAAALEKFPQKYSLSSILIDEPFHLKYEGQEWSPQNYDEKFRGPLRLRDALEKSVNVPAAKLAWDINLKNVVKVAKDMGIESHLPEIPSLALGSAEVSPLEVTKAYATFANQGFQTKPTAIHEVLNHKGEVLEKREMNLKQAITAETAYLTTYLLQGVLARGTGRFARNMGFTRPAGGKTGTTSDFKDAWFSGFTPELATTTWVGFDFDSNTGLTGTRAALPIWALFMKKAHKERPFKNFIRPKNIIFKNIDLRENCTYPKQNQFSFKEAYLKGTEPKKTCKKL